MGTGELVAAATRDASITVSPINKLSDMTRDWYSCLWEYSTTVVGHNCVTRPAAQPQTKSDQLRSHVGCARTSLCDQLGIGVETSWAISGSDIEEARKPHAASSDTEPVSELDISPDLWINTHYEPTWSPSGLRDGVCSQATRLRGTPVRAPCMTSTAARLLISTVRFCT